MATAKYYLTVDVLLHLAECRHKFDILFVDLHHAKALHSNV